MEKNEIKLQLLKKSNCNCNLQVMNYFPAMKNITLVSMSNLVWKLNYFHINIIILIIQQNYFQIYN